MFIKIKNLSQCVIFTNPLFLIQGEFFILFFSAVSSLQAALLKVNPVERVTIPEATKWTTTYEKKKVFL